MMKGGDRLHNMDDVNRSIEYMNRYSTGLKIFGEPSVSRKQAMIRFKAASRFLRVLHKAVRNNV